MQGFISGGDTGINPDALARRRKILDAMARQESAPRNVGEGLAAIGKALAYRIGNKKLEKQEAQLAGMQANAKYDPAVSDVTRALLGIPGYAKGTAFHPGGLAVVGEQGPELLNLPRGAQVIPNQYAQNIPPEYDAQMQDMTPQEQERTKTLMQEGESVPEAFAPEGYNPYDMMRESQLMDGMAVQTADAGGMKLTEGQSKDIGFFRRGLAANQELTPDREMALTQLTDSFAGNFGAVGRMFQDAEYQQAKRAANEFLAMVLRKDTGAAVTSEEFALYGPIYLPMPGDKPEVIAAKRNAREQFLRGLETGGGTAAKLYGQTREELMQMDDASFLKSLGLE